MAEKFVDINNRDEFVNALADLLTSDICHTKHKKGCLAPTCRDCIDRFFEMCSHLLPAADVAPVVHAHWYMCGGRACCSNCNIKALWKSDWDGCKNHEREFVSAKSNYCPHCGAKMDEASK